MTLQIYKLISSVVLYYIILTGFVYKTLQLGIDALYGQPHHIEITALQRCDTDIAYPFLNAIGPGLVEGLVAVYVVADFLLRKGFEGDMAGHLERMLAVASGETNAGDDLMPLSAQFA